MPREPGFSRALEREYLPYDPLARFKPVAFVDRSGTGGRYMDGVNSYGHRLARAWYRAQQEGRITVSMADEICIHMLHLHPAEVWGDLWWKDVE